MKIAIVTICDYFNHGNMLQNWALSRALQEEGHTVTSLLVSAKKAYRFVMKLAGALPFIPFLGRMNRAKRCMLAESDVRFIDKFSPQELSALNGEFDYFIAGSDQIWNPAYITNRDVSFLSFAHEEKRIAYAPSFGIDCLPDALKADFAARLNAIPALSVREDQGAEIIKALTGRDAPVVVDPTMLLKKDTWLEHFAAAPRKKLPTRYLLTYCLTVSRENAARIKQAARETGLPVIRINNPADRFFSATPKEFVYLLSHAELVLTNSFHGHAMSAILEKPYLSLQSASAKQSRLKTFAKKVQNIAAEREKGLTFLREAL